MSPKSKKDLAGEHLETARRAVADADLRNAVNALFYASEAAIAALAEDNAIDTKQSHARKADAASELHARGVLEADFAPLLRALNQARKDIWYEGDDPDFGEDDLETVAGQAEQLVRAARGETG